MVPLMMLVLALVVGSQIGEVRAEASSLIGVAVVYAAFLAVMALLGTGLARLFRLDVASSPALTFTGATRNSLVVLPLALALPDRYELAAVVVVTQTLVELLGMVAYVRLVPRLIPIHRSDIRRRSGRPMASDGAARLLALERCHPCGDHQQQRHPGERHEQPLGRHVHRHHRRTAGAERAEYGRDEHRRAARQRGHARNRASGQAGQASTSRRRPGPPDRIELQRCHDRERHAHRRHRRHAVRPDIPEHATDRRATDELAAPREQHHRSRARDNADHDLERVAIEVAERSEG